MGKMSYVQSFVIGHMNEGATLLLRSWPFFSKLKSVRGVEHPVHPKTVRSLMKNGYIREEGREAVLTEKGKNNERI